MNAGIRAILRELRRRLEELYGDRLAKVVLFGSRARGDAGPDSDLDIMIVLRGEVNYETERNRVLPITAELSLENNIVILCVYVSEARYTREQSPLLLNVRAEGVAV